MPSLIRKIIKPITMAHQVRGLRRVLNKSGENFYTNQRIEKSQFVDFLFLGEYEGKEVVWNACMTCASAEYMDKVLCKAYYKAQKIYPFKREESEEYSAKRRALIAAHEIKLIKEGKCKVKPWNIEIDESYRYGIGLHITVDRPYLGTGDIEDFLVRFYHHGEYIFYQKDNSPRSYTLKELGLGHDAKTDELMSQPYAL